MAWQLTNSLDAFLDAAGDHLRSDPVRHTVPLTVLETLRDRGLSAFGDSPPLFGWHRSAAGGTDGAFLQTPPFPLLLASLPAASAAPLLDVLVAGGRSPAAVNLAAEHSDAFLAAWTEVTNGYGTARMRMRQFRLGVLRPPDPAPPGAARVADQVDRDLLVGWHVAFGRESHGPAPEDPERLVAERLSHDGLMFWEADGEPVAMAGLTRQVAGVARVGEVYTPPEQRRLGYGGAITTAVSQAALDAGATAVVLYTDLANPTSNALYQRLGYEPVGDRVLLDLAGGDRGPSDVTSGSDVTGGTAPSSYRS
jgi:RimJ/RimL family protein N-acetyltransferase